MGLLSLFSCRDRMVDKSKLTNFDFRLFQGTPVWDLAKAVQDENQTRIRNLIEETGIDVDYQEGKFGQTLLMVAVKRHKYNSCKALLELGASPNKNNYSDGASAMIYAAEINGAGADATKFLSLLIKYGGDVNFLEKGERKKGNYTRNTPLLAACGTVNRGVSPLEKVKLLVESGADINFINEFHQFSVKEALVLGHYDVTLYLLKQGADYSHLFFDRAKVNPGGKKIYIADLLREKAFSLDSEEYDYKMKIVRLLEKKGVEYYSLPIPKSVKTKARKMYPDTWEDYLEKY